MEAFLQNITPLASHPALQQYFRNVDGIVSGACVHQNRRFRPIFEVAYQTLASGGAIFYWDWLHKLWKAETVKYGVNLDTSDEVYGAGEMARIWVGLHGYGNPPAAKELSPLQRKLEDDFYGSIATTGFNFHRWMKENLIGVGPNQKTKTPYRSAEGHREPEIPEGILRDLFGEVERYQFPPTHILHGFFARKERERLSFK